MATNRKDEPGRFQPDESENQPGYEAEDEAQRESRGDLDDRSEREDLDDRRSDEVSSPPPGGIDPDRDRKGRE